MRLRGLNPCSKGSRGEAPEAKLQRRSSRGEAPETRLQRPKWTNGSADPPSNVFFHDQLMHLTIPLMHNRHLASPLLTNKRTRLGSEQLAPSYGHSHNTTEASIHGLQLFQFKLWLQSHWHGHLEYSRGHHSRTPFQWLCNTTALAFSSIGLK